MLVYSDCLNMHWWWWLLFIIVIVFILVWFCVFSILIWISITGLLGFNIFTMKFSPGSHDTYMKWISCVMASLHCVAANTEWLWILVKMPRNRRFPSQVRFFRVVSLFVSRPSQKPFPSTLEKNSGERSPN
jgi:hypothetical protein